MGTRYRKVKFIAANAINKLIAPVANALYSLVLIRDHGTDFWGEFVIPLLVVNLSYQLIAWGHKDYLLKHFSENPASVNQTWTSNLLARASLLLLVLLILLAIRPFTATINLWVCIWILAVFLSRAFDVLILFEKKFTASTLIESITAASILIVIFTFGKEFNLTNLILLMGASQLLKALCLGFVFKVYFKAKASWQTGIQTIKESFGFFLPSVTGFLQNRIDIYLVALLMPKDSLGIYQILMNLMFITHSIIGFGLGPFIKNLYRIKVQTFRKVNQLMTLYGTLFCALSTGMIYLIMRYYYAFSLEPVIFGLVFIQMIPLTNYQLKIYQLFKINKQYTVVWINLALVLIYLPLTFWLIPTLGLRGALISNVANQWIALVAIYFTAKYYLEKLSTC